MGITRSQEKWQTIIEDQQTSGLTIIDYCQQQKLATSSFYAFRNKLGLSPDNFVHAKITQQVEFVEKRAGITITLGNANVSLPASTPVTYLSKLLRELVV